MNWNLKMAAVQLSGARRMEHTSIRTNVPDSALVPPDWVPHPVLQRGLLGRVRAQASVHEDDSPLLAVALAADVYAAKHPDTMVKARYWARKATS